MRNSDVFSPNNPSTSSRPSTLAFALLTLLAVTRQATAVPVTRRNPFFLDFLYPDWYTANTLSTASSAEQRKERERIKPERSAVTPGSSRPGSAAAGVRDTPQQRQQQPQRPRASQQQPQQQLRRLRRRELQTPTPVSPPLAKRTTANGNLVPIKYESIDQAGGWVIDDTWDLHGHHRRTDTTNTNGSSDSLPVQNLDTTDTTTNTTDTIDTIDPTDDTDGLDLPFGWQEGGLNPRHESYDPVIVAVFAVILVLCIVATIGLCRWRARKLRRLRDLERLEKEKDGGGEDNDNSSENGDGSSENAGSSESGSRLSKKKKRKFTIGSAGSSSAIRKRFARFRRRHRARRNGTAEEEKTSDAEEEQTPNNDQVVRDANGNDEQARTRPYAASIASGSTTTTTLSRPLTSHHSRSSATLENSTIIPASNDLTIPITINGIPIPISINGMGVEPDPPAIARASERGRRSARGGERPRITVTGSEIIPTTLDPTMNMAMAIEMDAPNAEPPAYPATSTSTSNIDTGGSNGGTRRTRNRTPLETTPHLHLPPPEKAPIPGLETEYDDRDLAGYSLLTPNSGLFNSRLSTSGTGLSPRSSAPPTRRPSRVRFADDHAGERGVTGGGGENDAHATDPEEEEQVPSFEPFVSSAGTSLGVLGASRAAAGAILRAHVATDDKGLLERLINVSSEPPLPPPPPISPPPPITGDASSSRVHVYLDGSAPPPAAIVAAAPSFSEIDQWELERQMARAHGSASPATGAESSSSFTTRAIQPTLAGSSSAFGSSPRRAGTSSNGFPALPAPLLPVFSTGAGASESGDVGYGLGTVWNSLNVVVGVPSMPPRSSTGGSGNGKARVPSAPPLATPASALRPSAPPPPMLDEDMGANGQAMPSAPPAWDDDEEDGPVLQPGTSNMESHAAPDVDESRIGHQPNTLPLQDNEGDASSDGDGDGAESIISTPPDNEEANSRWSTTFRTRPEEGAGLPRYEP